MRPHAPVQSRDGFHVVIEHLRRGVEYARDSFHVAAKIRRQDLDARLWQALMQRADCFRKVPRAAVVQIVAIHAGDHDVAKLQSRGHSRDIRRFIRIERTGIPALRHGTEPAAARAQIPEDHERRRTAIETLMHVGTARGFAHRVKIQATEFGFQIVDRFEMRARLAQPIGQPG